MEQHPIPRQITTFEFKLIGFMTLKQFLFLIIFAPIGFIVYKIIPIPVINIFLGVVIAGIGAAFAFIPIQDRPLDVWVRNFIKRLNSPTQYMYKKNNNSVYFLNNLFFVTDPHIALSHIETREKLQEYLQLTSVQEKQSIQVKRDKQRVHIDDLLKQNLPVPQLNSGVQAKGISTRTVNEQDSVVHKPFVSGVIKNRKQIPIPGILVAIKDSAENQLRLLKTNPYGVFATYSPLPEGNYLLEVSDPNGNYFFDTINVHIDPINTNDEKPILIHSKEIL